MLKINHQKIRQLEGNANGRVLECAAFADVILPRALLLCGSISRVLHDVPKHFLRHLQLARLGLVDLLLGVAVDKHLAAAVHDLSQEHVLLAQL